MFLAKISNFGVMNSKHNKVTIKKIIIGFRILTTLIMMDLPNIWAAINSPESFKNPKVKIAENYGAQR